MEDCWSFKPCDTGSNPVGFTGNESISEDAAKEVPRLRCRIPFHCSHRPPAKSPDSQSGESGPTPDGSARPYGVRSRFANEIAASILRAKGWCFIPPVKIARTIKSTCATKANLEKRGCEAPDVLVRFQLVAPRSSVLGGANGYCSVRRDLSRLAPKAGAKQEPPLT